MSYTDQYEQIRLLTFGTGTNAEILLGSVAAGIRARYIFGNRSYVLRAVSVVLNASSKANHPVFSIRRAAGPATTTATGTSITTLTVPAKAKGSTVIRRGLNTVFNAGDHLVLRTDTAATYALTCRAFAYVEPAWENPASNITGVSTVTS